MRNLLVTAIVLLTLGSSCAADFAGTYASEDGQNAVPNQPNMQDAQAQQLLFAHDVRGAKVEYERLLELDPRSGVAAAGYAVTSLLTLPYTPQFERIITRHLGARDGLDAQGDVLWGEQGLMFFTSRGVPWEDSATTAGIKTLLADRVPWTRQQLDTVDGFVSGLSEPVGLLAEDLVDLASVLADIASSLAIAANDEEFESFFLPGEVFWDDDLDLVLGKSEVTLLRAVVKAAEAGLYFFAAYDHDWTIERAFGESAWQPVIADPMDPDHIVDGEPVDYQVAHLNASLGREIGNEARLGLAREASADALHALADGIGFGVAEVADTALNWRAADANDEAAATQLTEFIRALADSVVDGPVTLPYTEPSQEANLALLFEGRVVAPEQNLLAVERVDDGFGLVAEVVVDEDGLQSVLDGVFVPPFDSEPAPELTIGDDVERLLDNVLTELADDLERSVGGAL